MQLTIEKVILLKSVEFFSQTNDDVLAEVATILEEIEVKAGDMVIEKGEIGRSMYIIVNGQVRVLDGKRELAILENRSLFGELAALDPEPRSASVQAIDDTVLLRLDQDSLFEMMEEHIEVAHSIIRYLVRRYRTVSGELGQQGQKK